MMLLINHMSINHWYGYSKAQPKKGEVTVRTSVPDSHAQHDVSLVVSASKEQMSFIENVSV